MHEEGVNLHLLLLILNNSLYCRLSNLMIVPRRHGAELQLVVVSDMVFRSHPDCHSSGLHSSSILHPSLPLCRLLWMHKRSG